MQIHRAGLPGGCLYRYTVVVLQAFHSRSTGGVGVHVFGVAAVFNHAGAHGVGLQGFAYVHAGLAHAGQLYVGAAHFEVGAGQLAGPGTFQLQLVGGAAGAGAAGAGQLHAQLPELAVEAQVAGAGLVDFRAAGLLEAAHVGPHGAGQHQLAQGGHLNGHEHLLVVVAPVAAEEASAAGADVELVAVALHAHIFQLAVVAGGLHLERAAGTHHHPVVALHAHLGEAFFAKGEAVVAVGAGVGVERGCPTEAQLQAAVVIAIVIVIVAFVIIIIISVDVDVNVIILVVIVVGGHLLLGAADALELVAYQTVAVLLGVVRLAAVHEAFVANHAGKAFADAEAAVAGQAHHHFQ